MKTLIEKTYWARIYIAGDIDVARQTLREECMREGLCVTLEPCDYIFTAGLEYGMVVGFINYPRFPQEKEKITARAIQVAKLLKEKLCQSSCAVMTPDETVWLSTREEK